MSDREISLHSDAYGDWRLPLADARDRGEHVPESLEPLVGLIDSYFDDGLRGVHLEISSEMPVGAGMSSSTAVLVALTAALSASLGYPVDAQSIRARALQWQAEIHGGRASGVEFFSSLYGGIHWVVGSIGTMLSTELPHMVIADTGLSRSTAKGVASYKDQPSFIRSLLDECDRARTSLEGRDWASLGEAMFAVHELLRSIGVSNDPLDRLVEAARESGAWGAKLSGAGGGGVVVAIVPEAALVRVTAALRTAGAATVFEALVDHHGLTLE